MSHSNTGKETNSEATEAADVCIQQKWSQEVLVGNGSRSVLGFKDITDTFSCLGEEMRGRRECVKLDEETGL